VLVGIAGIQTVCNQHYYTYCSTRQL